MNQKHRNLLILIILSFLFNLWVFYPGFDRYSVSNDAVLSSYIFYDLKYGLFRDDINSLAHTHTVPYGYLYTIYILSFILPFLILTKVLPFILSTFCVITLYLVGLKLKNARLGYFLSILFLLYSSTFYFLSGATPRAFQLPFILLFIYLFINDRFFWCCSLAAISSLFYFPLNAILLLTLFFSMVRLHRKRIFFISDRSKVLFLSIAILVSLVLLFTINIHFWDSPKYSFDEAKRMQEFNKGGAHYYFGNIVLDFFSRLFRFYEGESLYSGFFAFENYISVLFTFILVLSFVFFLAMFRKKAFYLPPVIYSLFFSSLILFLASHISNFFNFMGIMLLPLYYTKAVFPIFLIFLISINLERAVTRFGSRKAFTFLTTILISFAPFYISYFESGFDRCPINDKLIEIEELGNDVLLAGHPLFIRFIPLFNKQRILFGFDTAILELRPNYELIKGRMNDFFCLVYSNESSQFETFCNKYNVTHLILDKDFVESDPYSYQKNNLLEVYRGIAIINGTLPDNYFLRSVEIPENKSIAILQCPDKNYIRYI